MKKVYSLMLLILFSTVHSAYAGNSIQLLDGATATGPGTSKILGGPAMYESYKDWGCVAAITGSPTAVKVCLQGDPAGGTRYADMVCIEFTATELTAGYAVRGGATQVANSIRGNVETLTGGASPIVSLWCTGVK